MAADLSSPRLAIPHFVQHRLRLADGRRVVAAEYGERSSLPIVYLHGFLGSRLEPLAGGDIGRNLIAVDRPGYGGTMPMPEPSLRQFGLDLRETLDRLGVERCGLVGVSAGAPFAVAAGVALGPRVARCVLVCGVGGKHIISDWGGAVAIMRRVNRRLGLAQALLPQLFRNLKRHGLDARVVRLLLNAEGRTFAGDIDRAHLARCLVASVREGTRPGLTGPFGDIRLLTRRWDISAKDFEAPTLILHARDDQVVPVAHAQWYHRQLADSLLEILPQAGHISLPVNEARRIAEEATRPT